MVGCHCRSPERDFFVDNLLVRIHKMILVDRPFAMRVFSCSLIFTILQVLGSLISTFLQVLATHAIRLEGGGLENAVVVNLEFDKGSKRLVAALAG